MDVRAAVAHPAGQPLTIETVQLEGLKEGEVLVEIKASGICRTDAFTLSGGDPEGLFPTILGHEGAGVVIDIGPGVTSVAKDDHVIPLYTPDRHQQRDRRHPVDTAMPSITWVEESVRSPIEAHRAGALTATEVVRP